MAVRNGRLRENLFFHIKVNRFRTCHFVFPESMLKTMLPVGSGLFVKLAFQAARKYPEECRSARLDIDRRVRNAVAEWKSAERDG